MSGLFGHTGANNILKLRVIILEKLFQNPCANKFVHASQSHNHQFNEMRTVGIMLDTL